MIFFMSTTPEACNYGSFMQLVRLKLLKKMSLTKYSKLGIVYSHTGVSTFNYSSHICSRLPRLDRTTPASP